MTAATIARLRNAFERETKVAEKHRGHMTHSTFDRRNRYYRAGWIFSLMMIVIVERAMKFNSIHWCIYGRMFVLQLSLKHYNTNRKEKWPSYMVQCRMYVSLALLSAGASFGCSLGRCFFRLFSRLVLLSIVFSAAAFFGCFLGCRLIPLCNNLLQFRQSPWKIRYINLISVFYV